MLRNFELDKTVTLREVSEVLTKHTRGTEVIYSSDTGWNIEVTVDKDEIINVEDILRELL